MATLGREVISRLLIGPGDDGRLVHDSPIRGDVWAAYAAEPGGRVDVLIEVHRDTASGEVAARLARRLYRGGTRAASSRDPQDGYDISHVEGFVTARLTLPELATAVLPFTRWMRDLALDGRGSGAFEELRRQVRADLEAMRRPDAVPPRSLERQPLILRMAATFRVLAAIAWAEGPSDGRKPEAFEDPEAFLDAADPDAIASLAAELARDAWSVSRRAGRASQRGPSSADGADVFAVSRNRPVELAVERSVPAIKADAASSLFSVSCERIGWAILDTGVAGEHPAFDDAKRPGRSRVVATYDFTRLRHIILADYLYNADLLRRRSEELAASSGMSPRSVEAALRRLARDARDGRPIDWSVAARFVEERAPSPPANPHGTHVAGILGGRWTSSAGRSGTTVRSGVCPDIRLYDFRVVGSGVDDTEFAIVGALQFIRYLNSRNNHPLIHGANISLSIRHDVRNYACGRTPVCDEATRAVESGVVVVAAAGNRGYQSYNLTGGGAFETYAPSSITDPGNAEAVITVGATHRFAPHTYGVSFFSSRGPTGDGRQKPDLVAPGEKIWGPIPGGSEDAMSGTSMSTPHVSGAAAMLMARNPEFMGRAAEIKQILRDSCTDLGRERSFQGSGMVDILRAMQQK